MARRYDVKGLRDRLGLTQEALAKKLSVDKRTIIRWENAWSDPSPMALAHLRRVESEAREARQAGTSTAADSQDEREQPGEAEAESAPASSSGPVRRPLGVLPSLGQGHS